MSLKLDFALFYLYLLALGLYVVLWLIPHATRTLVHDLRARLAARRGGTNGPGAAGGSARPETRLEAFTRIC
jgi:hypothetical protein